MSNIGFTIWARQVIDSKIFYYKPAMWFKIWFFIVNRVNYRDGKLFNRGEALITYREIMEKTGSTKKQTENCIKWLKKETMLETRRTTRGVVYFVVTYAKYQDMGFSKGDNKGDTLGEREENERRTGGGADSITKKQRNKETRESTPAEGLIKHLENLYFKEEEIHRLKRDFTEDILNKHLNELDSWISVELNSPECKYRKPLDGSHYLLAKQWITRNLKANDK